jgi:Complex I intermediate-associated protein 30 (CIA30)
MTFPTVFRGFLSSQVLLACCLVVMTGSVRADATPSLLFGFDTEAGRWQEIRLPLKAFQATWFGRKQANAPEINGADIRSLGFTLADKKAGPFKLDVDWIGAASNAAFAP